MSSLYPSLEDLKFDNTIRASMNSTTEIVNPNPSNGVIYPLLNDYMGLELSSTVLALNMPEYHSPPVQLSSTNTALAPLSSQSKSLSKAVVTQAVRQVVLCKDEKGKCGLRLHSINNGVIVCHVAAGSPAAKVGLRFGDQVLEVNNIPVAGKPMKDVHDIIKKSPVNGIVMAVRDRPLERTITLHKNELGQVGFQFKDGKIVRLVKDSSAALNGLLTDHQILEINTINVVGLADKEISKIINESAPVVNITIIPHVIYKHMINKMSNVLFKNLDRTPAI